MNPKVIVITGASSGIGAALAKQLGQRGEKIVLAARREAQLKEVAAQSGPDALSVVTDVTRRGDVQHLCAEALRAFGHVDVWVNNAGQGIGTPVLDLTDEDFDAMMAVNAKSSLYGMQAIIPHFKERGEGHLINISSMLGRVPFASYRSAYNAAKAALNSLTTNLRWDLRTAFPNIHVSLVLFPTVFTDFHKNALHGTPPLNPGATRVGKTAEEAASALVDLIDHPRSEMYMEPGQAETVARFYTDIDAFEANMRR
jgi:NAD(P)-dependent dehydrogenase (short-subunit alcohol dehydrogenase family)